jgi:hypothetical protein
LKKSITTTIVEEISISELVRNLVSIYKYSKVTQIRISWFRNKYEIPPEIEKKVFYVAYDIFLILLELKMQHPLIKELIDFGLSLIEKGSDGSKEKVE